MANKIYDIMPPKEEVVKPVPASKKIEDSGVVPVKFTKEPELIVENLPQQPIQSTVEKPKTLDKPTEQKKPISQLPVQKIEKPKQIGKSKLNLSLKAWVVIIAIIVVLSVVIYFFFSLQKVEIVIWPKTEVLSFDNKITADKSANAIDLDKNVIPVQVFESSQDLWQDFEATGIATNSGKASGTIKVYNKLSPTSPFVLKSGTHFLSDSGKYFVTTKMVTIPAASTKTGKLIAGSVSVQVVAEEAGKDSNISASKFSIPKLAGTNYYYAIYAESTTPMSGGYSGQVKKVTDADLAGAKDILSKKVLGMALEDIKKKISQDYVLFDNAISNNVLEAFSSVKSGAIVDNFNYQVKVKAIALAFKRQDIEQFAKNKLSLNLKDKQILESSFKIDFNPELVDINAGKITLNSKFSASIYQPVDVNELIPLIEQKNNNEIKSILESRLSGQLNREEINFWPFWTSRAPSNIEKIKVDLKFE